MSLPAIRRDFRRTLSRFANLSFGQIVALYRRAFALQIQAWLGRKPRSVKGEETPPTSHRRRIVVSLTTIPDRANGIRPTLLSLLDQDMPADRLVLALPHQSLRNGAHYPDPASLDLPIGVDVVRCEDVGPATKILPVLQAEPEALIVVVDDDVIYPRDFISTLTAGHNRMPNACLALRGVEIDKSKRFVDLHHVLTSAISDDTPVDIVFGTWGYLVPAWLCDDEFHNFAAHPDQVRWVDDVYISGHLARLNVPRFIVSSQSFPVETFSAHRSALSSGINQSGANDQTAIESFEQYW